MSEPRDAAAIEPTSRGPFPPYLDEITATLKFDEGELAFADLLTGLEGKPTVSTRTDGGGVRGAARGMPGWGSVHTHYTLQRAAAGGYLFEFELTSKSHGKFARGVPSTRQFLSMLRDSINDPSRKRAAILGAHFSFSMDEWQPTVPLPFIPPDTLDHIPGVPKISGLDFSFSEPGSEQPLVRAFVTTYDHQKEIVVRLLIAHSLVIGPDVPDSLVELATNYVPHFVRRRVINE